MSVNMSHSNSNPIMLLHFKCESIGPFRQTDIIASSSMDAETSSA